MSALSTFENNTVVVIFKRFIEVVSSCLKTVKAIPGTGGFTLEGIKAFASNLGTCVSGITLNSQFATLVLNTLTFSIQFTLSTFVTKIQQVISFVPIKYKGETLDVGEFGVFFQTIKDYTKDFRDGQKEGGLPTGEYFDGPGNYTLERSIFQRIKNIFWGESFSKQKRQVLYKYIFTIAASNAALAITMVITILENVPTKVVLSILAIGFMTYFWTLALLSPEMFSIAMFFLKDITRIVGETDAAESVQMFVARRLRSVRHLLLGAGLKSDLLLTSLSWMVAFYQQVLSCWMQKKDENGNKKPCCMAKFFKEYKEVLDREKKSPGQLPKGGNLKGLYATFNPGLANYLSRGSATNNLVYGPTKTKTIGCVENFKGYCIKMYRVKGTNKVIFRPSVAELQKKVPEAVKTNDKNKTTVIMRSKLPSDLRMRLREWNKM